LLKVGKEIEWVMRWRRRTKAEVGVGWSNGFEDCGRSSLHCKRQDESAAETHVVWIMKRQRKEKAVLSSFLDEHVCVL
jgi:hypothetical protein